MSLRAGQARHARPHSSLHRAVAVSLTVIVVVASLLVAAVVLATAKLNANLTVENPFGKLGTDRPTPVRVGAGHTKPLDVLMIGSDTRDGANGFVGGSKGVGRSDTTILLHISGDRRRAVGVSIPRDSMVDAPDCVRADGSTAPGARRMFNESYSIGGATCVARTVEQLTGVFIDHFVVVDFSGFKRMVDALGKISVCVPQDVDDTLSKIVFKAGQQNLDGNQALNYVRLRHGLTNGSDIGRVHRQQEFLASMISKAKSTSVLTNPGRLYSFLNAATQSLTLDPGLGSINKLRGLATEVNRIGLDHIQFLTVPNVPDPQNANRVVWSEPRASQLWRLLVEDKPLPGEAPTSGSSATPSPTATPTVTATVPVAPAAIRVRVLDGAHRPDLAARAAKDLRALGFDVVGSGTAARSDYAATTVLHSATYNRSALTLSTALRGAVSTVDPTLSRTLVVVVGTDYAGVRPVVLGSAAPSPTPSSTKPFDDVVNAGKPAVCAAR